MIKSIVIGAVLAGFAAPAVAMLKCVDSAGNTTYTDASSCSAGSRPKVISDVNASSGSGLSLGERRMLEQINANEARQQYQRQRDWNYERRHTLTFEDRNRIRELEMQKSDLRQQLRRNNGSWSQNLSTDDQIHAIDRQIQQIRAPKY